MNLAYFKERFNNTESAYLLTRRAKGDTYVVDTFLDEVAQPEISEAINKAVQIFFIDLIIMCILSFA